MLDPMPLHYEYTLHTNGRALWPEHKSLDEVLQLKAVTPDRVFSATWQGMPTPDGGLVFLRDWWEQAGARYGATELQPHPKGPQIVGRWLSVDTAFKDREDSDETAILAFELLADYRGRVRWVETDKLTFPRLPGAIRAAAERWNEDKLLRGVLIEDKGSGTSAIQTLQQGEDEWLRHLLIPFIPTTPKEQRAEQAALWCQNQCVQLPTPGEHAPWLVKLQSDIFSFPSGEHDDITDALSMAILYLEHLLSDGWRFRNDLR